MNSLQSPTRAYPRAIALVPAAGIGSRMQTATPKQYLTLAGQTLIEHVVAAFLPVAGVDTVIVVVAPNDSVAATLPGLVHERVRIVAAGGPTRRDTVLAGLEAVAAQHDDPWVMVHDAARPGIRSEQIARLLIDLCDDPVGGVLAMPVVDTVKRMSDDRRIERTEPRDGLWLAQTPQMFRLALLRRALALHSDVTDEAQAVERLGLPARLLAGSRRNLKVSMPDHTQSLHVLA